MKYTVVADKAGAYDLTVSARGEGQASAAVNGEAAGVAVATAGAAWTAVQPGEGAPDGGAEHRGVAVERRGGSGPKSLALKP